MTSPGVRAVDNDRRGKVSLHYDGHGRKSGTLTMREIRRRKWRRQVNARLREQVRS